MGTTRKVRLGQNRLDNIFFKNSLLLCSPHTREARGWRTDMGTSRKVRLGQNRLGNILLKNTLLLDYVDLTHAKLGAGKPTWAPLERLG